MAARKCPKCENLHDKYDACARTDDEENLDLYEVMGGDGFEDPMEHERVLARQRMRQAISRSNMKHPTKRTHTPPETGD